MVKYNQYSLEPRYNQTHVDIESSLNCSWLHYHCHYYQLRLKTLLWPMTEHVKDHDSNHNQYSPRINTPSPLLREKSLRLQPTSAPFFPAKAEETPSVKRSLCDSANLNLWRTCLHVYILINVQLDAAPETPPIADLPEDQCCHSSGCCSAQGFLGKAISTMPLEPTTESEGGMEKPQQIQWRHQRSVEAGYGGMFSNDPLWTFAKLCGWRFISLKWVQRKKRLRILPGMAPCNSFSPNSSSRSLSRFPNSCERWWANHSTLTKHAYSTPITSSATRGGATQKNSAYRNWLWHVGLQSCWLESRSENSTCWTPKSKTSIPLVLYPRPHWRSIAGYGYLAT